MDISASVGKRSNDECMAIVSRSRYTIALRYTGCVA